MSPTPSIDPGFERAQFPSCSLDAAGMREQRARYARLAATVTRAARRDGALLVTFAPDLDRQLLNETLARELECCSFFRFSFDDAKLQLRATVADREMLPSLDAIADSLAPASARAPQPPGR